MIYARVKFTLSGLPRLALLTDRGWTVVSGGPNTDCLVNHICPLEFPADATPEQKTAIAAVCAARGAELLRGTVEA